MLRNVYDVFQGADACFWERMGQRESAAGVSGDPPAEVMKDILFERAGQVCAVKNSIEPLWEMRRTDPPFPCASGDPVGASVRSAL